METSKTTSLLEAANPGSEPLLDAGIEIAGHESLTLHMKDRWVLLRMDVGFYVENT